MARRETGWAPDGSTEIAEAQLRRWLGLIRKPDQLFAPEITTLLSAHGRLPSNASRLAVGQAAAALLTESIENLHVPEEAGPEQELPHLVLKTCFLEGAKLFQAATKLGLSERQLSRERARAIAILKAELEAPLKSHHPPSYRPEPIPSIRGFMARPAVSRRLKVALERERLANVHGPPGIGKTSLVAEYATEAADSCSVLWYRFRTGVNSSLDALLFELGDYLADQGSPDLVDYLVSSLPSINESIATRFSLKGLSAEPHLLVFDDYHLVEADATVAGFLDELISRLPELRVVTVGRHRSASAAVGAPVDVPPFSRTEMKTLMTQLGVKCSTQLIHTLHSWTEGNTHLIKLAASWLRTAQPEEVTHVVASLKSREEVRSFLMDNVTDLLDSDDQAILDAASIFRGRCSDEALAYVSGRTSGAVLDASLRLVRSYIATRNKDGDSAFFHGTLRDYVYDRLAPEERSELHLRAATWFRKAGNHEEATFHRAMAAGAEQEVS